MIGGISLIGGEDSLENDFGLIAPVVVPDVDCVVSAWTIGICNAN